MIAYRNLSHQHHSLNYADFIYILVYKFVIIISLYNDYKINHCSCYPKKQIVINKCFNKMIINFKQQ